MIDCNRIFVDTSPFIYFLEKNPLHFEKTKVLFEECIEKRIQIVTSVITTEEYLVYPYKQGDFNLVNNFHDFIDFLNADIIEINKNIAETASKIRAEYNYFKAMDALQLAVAVNTKCDLFWTNDKQLRQEKLLPCLTVDELQL